jgi:hypothetical protein
MFGLSLSKIVFTILVIVAVWRAWRLIGPLIARLQTAAAPAPPPPRKPPPAGRREAKASVDLVECPKCGTFVPAGTWCPSKEACTLRRG